MEIMARKRKNRTHLKGANAPEPSSTGSVPKSIIIKHGQVGHSIAQLVRDMRKVMEPNTASRLKERSRNKLKDFLTMGPALSVSHLLAFTLTPIAPSLRIVKLSDGPTLSFRVERYSLMKDIMSTSRRARSVGMEYLSPPLLVLASFPPPSPTTPPHLPLLMKSFQSIFPPLSPHTLSLSSARRVVLISYNPDRGTVDFRHYIIKVKPYGVSKRVRRVLEGATSSVLDLGNEKDVADFLLRKRGEPGPDGGYESAASSTESVAGDDGDAVDLAEDYVGRNNKKGQRRAVRLDEVGPRMELKLIKITEGVPGKEGAVMYHEFVKKSKKEINSQKAEHAAKAKVELGCQERRRRSSVEVNNVAQTRPASVDNPVMAIERRGVPSGFRSPIVWPSLEVDQLNTAACLAAFATFPLHDFAPSALIYGVMNWDDSFHVRGLGVVVLARHSGEELGLRGLLSLGLGIEDTSRSLERETSVSGRRARSGERKRSHVERVVWSTGHASDAPFADGGREEWSTGHLSGAEDEEAAMRHQQNVVLTPTCICDNMPSSKPVFSTPLTKLFKINHPVMLAGMNVAAGPKLAAAVTNAGGIGTIGGVRQNPKFLAGSIEELKSHLEDKNAPFGVDLLIPQVGGSARKTNKDYTEGQLPELIDVVIKGGASLFVCAVGVPPKWVVDKLHAAGIPVMNMVGHPKHVPKALAQGVDIICAQGGEGGGHTGDTAFSILIPAVVDICKGHKSPLTGEDVLVVAAGGLADGRGLAAALAYGAAGVWVGTRFVASVEAGAPKMHKDLVLSAGYDDVVRTLIFSGRPMSVRKTPYVAEWEDKRSAEIRELCAQGKIPHEVELQSHPEKSAPGRQWLMGRVAGSIKDIKPAKEIVDEFVNTAAQTLNAAAALQITKAKL
ncbi:hypothetical protein D9619_005873 [Psilocybe cf. subviscida]|uniref:Brix domain-containing protein n=1 Tax=Psilocybe cf. subviscida TaxID=2480587 RepID=A0A8H5FBC9_9AGAR|nr:hypothetical protein D9619_005873 [Psilocybe cf. subviscida]